MSRARRACSWTRARPPGRRAYNEAGSADRTLAFVYTVRPGDETGDLEYAGTGALAAGEAIRDAAGNDANLTLPRPGSPESLGGSKDIAIDTTAPARPGEPASVLLVYSPDAGGAYGSGAAINITVAFSRDVRVSGAIPVLALSTDPPRRAEHARDADGGDGDGYDDELAFLYTVQPGDAADPLDYANGSALYLNGAAIVDADGNNASLALARSRHAAVAGRLGHCDRGCRRPRPRPRPRRSPRAGFSVGAGARRRRRGRRAGAVLGRPVRRHRRRVLRARGGACLGQRRPALPRAAHRLGRRPCRVRVG